MTSTRWHCGLLEGLPRDGKRRLPSELRRSIRSGSLPSRRAWKAPVSEASTDTEPAADRTGG
ncbi:MAG: hypothetical protein VCF24_25195 [Candidatus Latescibacterota bacterium]